MTFITFLSAYWQYITTPILAIWVVVQYVRAQRLEKKKSLRDAYLQLNNIINTYLIDCSNNFISIPKVLEFDMQLGENIENVKKLLTTIDDERVDTHGKLANLIMTSQQLHKEFLATSDIQIKDEKMKKLELQIIEAKQINAQIQEENTRKQAILEDASFAQMEISRKIEDFNSLKNPKKIVELSRITSNLITGLQTTPLWQLTASHQVIAILKKIQSAADTLNSVCKKTPDFLWL